MMTDLFEQPRASIKEEWKPVPGFPGYEVSTFGKFRRWDGKTIRGTISHNGYIHIGLSLSGRQIWKLAHRLVAEAFLPRPSPLHEVVNHGDKNRANNAITNLQWVTRSQNAKHARAF